MVFYVMLLNLFDTVAKRSCWLFQLHVKEGDKLIVHLPLVYRSDIYAELEAYARAAHHFAATAGMQVADTVELVDDCVFHFSADWFQQFKLHQLTQLMQPAAQVNLARQSIQLRKGFETSCLLLEKCWLQQKPLHEPFALANEQLVKLIAINLANPFYEAFYLFLHEHKYKDELFQQLKQRYLLPPSFSHIGFYAGKFAQLQQAPSFQTINDYFWNASFLKEHAAAGHHDHVTDTYMQQFSIEDFTGNYSPPDAIRYDPAGITDDVPGNLQPTEQVFYMLRLLQVNEEFRHYWQARFMRWMKLYFSREEAANLNFNSLYTSTRHHEPAIT